MNDPILMSSNSFEYYWIEDKRTRHRYQMDVESADDYHYEAKKKMNKQKKWPIAECVTQVQTIFANAVRAIYGSHSIIAIFAWLVVLHSAKCR